MNGLPWFKVYARDLLADSRFSSWTMDERGAWLTLLAHNWHDGSIPSGLTDLARLLHVSAPDMSRIWSAIGDRFSPSGDPGRLVSPRLEEEREKANQLIDRRSDAGSKGASGRWNKRKPTDGKRIRLPKQPTSTGYATAMAKNAIPASQKPACQPPDSSLQIAEASQPEAEDRLAGGVNGSALILFRSALAERLDLPKAIAVGKDPDRVVEFFRQQIATVGEECVLNDCVQVAKRSQSGTPSSLSWFVGWLERLPMQKPVEAP